MMVRDHYKISDKNQGYKYYRLIPKRRAAPYFFTALLLVIIGISVIKSISVKAESSIFHPTSCLGGWSSPHNAEGEPEVSNSNEDGKSPVRFSDSNSAWLSENTAADIYCGEFKGEIPDDSFAKKIILTFSWATLKNIQAEMLGESASNLEDDTDSGIASSSLPATSDESVDVGSTTQNFNATTTVESTQSDETVDESTDKPVTQPIVEPTVESNTESQNIQSSESPVTYLFKQIQKIQQITQKIFVQNVFADDTPTPLSQNTGNEFLEVFYTIDGTKWNSLGKVDAEHLRYATFEIPLARDTKWSDMSNIQINIKSFPSIDGIPAVYLDGMSLEVIHGDASDADFVSESGLYIPSARSDVDKFDFQIRTNNEIEELVIDGSAPLGNIVVFNASTSESVLTTYIQGAQYILQPEYFGEGDYSVIATDDPDACAGLSLEACRSNQYYVGEGSFAVHKREAETITDTVVESNEYNQTNTVDIATSTEDVQ